MLYSTIVLETPIHSLAVEIITLAADSIKSSEGTLLILLEFLHGDIFDMVVYRVKPENAMRRVCKISWISKKSVSNWSG